ncbi:MAG: O-antigen ligase family protein [Candidatus Levyibacteriota bacterium]
MKDYLGIINKGINGCFYALFFLVPLILYPKTFELFEFNKLWITLGFSLVILFLWVSKMLSTGKIILRKTPFDIPILLFLASQMIATIFSIEPHTSFWGYYGRFNGGLTSLMAYIFLYYAFVSNFPVSLKSEEPESVSKLHVGLAFGSMLLWAFLNVISGSSPFFQNLFLILMFASPCIFFIKAFQVPPFKKLLYMMFSSTVVVALWGFTSHFGYDLTCLVFRGSFDVSCWTDSFQPTVRLFSTLGQPNWLAAYLSILIPPTLTLGVYKVANTIKNEKGVHASRDMLTGVGILAAAGLFFKEVIWTQSQSGYVGFLIGLVFYAVSVLFFLKIKSEKISAVFKGLFIKTSVVFLIILFLLSFFSFNSLQNKIPLLTFNGVQSLLVHNTATVKKAAPVEKPVGELGGSDSGKIRLAVWRGALEIFKQHPLFGTGVETFAYAYYKVKPVEHNLLSEWDYLYNKAHNEYLNYLATTGAFGLGSYLLMIVVFLVYAIRYLLKTAKSTISSPSDLLPPFMILSLLAAYISILISNFFGFSVVVINLYFFLIPALVLAFAKKLGEEQQLEYSMRPLKLLGVFGIAIFCLYGELILLRVWFGDQSYAMGYNLDRAQEYVMANPYLEDAVKLFPDEDLYNSELSLNLATLGLLFYQQKQPDQGAIFINRAKDISDVVVANHPQNIVFYKTRIQLLFELSQIDPKNPNNTYYKDAIDAINYAETLAPTDAKIAYNAGLLYGQEGQIPEALVQLRRAINLKPNYKEPRYAISVYLSELAKVEKDPVKKESYQQEAKTNLNYILTNINQDDTQTKDLLKTLE